MSITDEKDKTTHLLYYTYLLYSTYICRYLYSARNTHGTYSTVQYNALAESVAMAVATPPPPPHTPVEELRRKITVLYIGSVVANLNCRILNLN